MVRLKLDGIDGMIVMPREEFDKSGGSGMMRKLAAGLRPISFLAHPILRFFSGTLKLLQSSEMIATGFSKLAILLGGRKRADEIIVLATKKR